MQLRTSISPAARAGRVLLLILAVTGLLLGMWAGLIRLGWGALPPLRPLLPALHGPLMAGGFLGVLIGLERAVGTGQRWAYAGPALVALGTGAALAGAPGGIGPLLMIAGSLVVTLVLAGLVRLQPALFTATMAIGGLAWVIGNVLWWLGWPVPVAALWWMGFLVLTIAGERLELSRMLKLSAWSWRAFVGATVLLLAGLLVSVAAYAVGMAICGAALLLLALWLLRYDIARRRIKAGGQARFTALALLSGYVWLGIGALLLIRHAGVTAGPYYDAALHSIFLGFVFAMIFAHAPIVFPVLPPARAAASLAAAARRRRSAGLVGRPVVGRAAQCRGDPRLSRDHGYVAASAPRRFPRFARPTRRPLNLCRQSRDCLSKPAFCIWWRPLASGCCWRCDPPWRCLCLSAGGRRSTFTCSWLAG